MTQTFQCPSCNAPLDYDGSGRSTIRCPYCQNSVVVPEELRGGAQAPEEVERDWTAPSSLVDVAANVKGVRELIRSGNKIAAIKLFRETFEVGLKEAKDAVEAMGRGEPVNLTSYKVLAPTHVQFFALDASTSDRIKVLLEQGNKIKAIELYRAATGQGLKESKDAVDAMDLGFQSNGMYAP
jgi:LSD1 subclass zinc finger protein